jgi:hypothetical protein
MPFDPGSPYEEQPLTRPAPTAANQGQSLKSVDAVTVALEAAEGQTLAGSGTLRCWVFDKALNRGAGAWVRVPALDLTVPADAAGLRRYAFEPFDAVGSRAMRLLYAADAVGVSGGTTVTVYQLTHDRELERFYKEG